MQQQTTTLQYSNLNSSMITFPLSFGNRNIIRYDLLACLLLCLLVWFLHAIHNTHQKSTKGTNSVEVQFNQRIKLKKRTATHQYYYLLNPTPHLQKLTWCHFFHLTLIKPFPVIYNYIKFKIDYLLSKSTLCKTKWRSPRLLAVPAFCSPPFSSQTLPSWPLSGLFSSAAWLWVLQSDLLPLRHSQTPADCQPLCTKAASSERCWCVSLSPGNPKCRYQLLAQRYCSNNGRRLWQGCAEGLL